MSDHRSLAFNIRYMPSGDQQQQPQQHFY